MPVLVHPDPNKSFIVEVDTSSTGIGPVLSQQQGIPPKLHLIAFFSRKLSLAEKNYEMGNRALLAIKLALEEWRHWLEGAHHPFTVLTDHKNLEYLCKAKRLNPCQARWAFFSPILISYRHGSKNGKTKAETPEPVIAPHLIVIHIQWSLEEQLSQANASENPLLGCPPGRQYVPHTLRTPLITSVHSSVGTGHPGSNQTLSLLQDHFWWPGMAKDVRRFTAPSTIR